MDIPQITHYKPKEFAALIGVSVKTLQRWDREGTLLANRTLTNRRYYTYEQYLQFTGATESTNKKEQWWIDVRKIKDIMTNAFIDKGLEVSNDCVDSIIVRNVRPGYDFRISITSPEYVHRSLNYEKR